MNPDISVVITIHSEGRILHHTFTALHRAIRYAQSQHAVTEVVAVLDRVTDSVIADVLGHWKSILGEGLSTYDVDFGALSPSRNFGISQSNGEFISILDGDDLYGRHWLLEAYRTCRADPNKIAHPWFIYVFPIDPYLISYNEEKSAYLDLLLGNQWSALSMAHRDIFGDIPYVKDDETYAFQDWLWNCHTSAAGHEHVLIPRTLMAVRQSPPGRSLWQSSYHLNKVVRPNIHHKKILLREYPEFLVAEDREKKEPDLLHFVRAPIKKWVRRAMDHLYGTSPSVHGFVINRKRSLVHRIRKALNSETVPSWVREEIAEIAKIEPTLKTTRNIQTRKPIGKIDITGLITAPMSALVSADKPAVYIIDKADMGHVHQMALHYMRVSGRPNFLLSTATAETPWDAPLPEGSHYLPMGEVNLVYEKRLKLTHRILLECDPRLIHVFDSRMAMELFDRYANTFSGKMVLGTFLLYNEDEGANAVGVPLNKYPHLMDFFSGISTNTAYYKKILLDTFGLEESFIHLHRTAFSSHFSGRLFESPPGDRSRYTNADSTEHAKMIWLASGKDRGSLRKITRVVSTLHQGLENTRFEIVQSSKGSFLQSAPWHSRKLKTHRLDLLSAKRSSPIVLNTRCFLVAPHLSPQDVPFIVHAMGNGIPLIAGEGELAAEFCTEETGWLLERDSLAEGLRHILQENLNNRDSYIRKSQACRSFIEAHHSWESFRRDARLFYGDDGGQRTA